LTASGDDSFCRDAADVARHRIHGHPAEEARITTGTGLVILTYQRA
jgi:hypothetical protein